MITRSIVFESSDATLVAAYNASTQQQGSYWEEEEVNPIRAAAKSFYLTQQQFRCCYCNKHYPSAHGRVWDVEHIVSKSIHPRFLFEPKNLAVSCIDCNGFKGDQEVMINPSRRGYPNNSTAFKILHPHFDNFDDHLVDYLEKYYAAKSKKGEETIKVCSLTRFAYRDLGLPGDHFDEVELRTKAADLLDAPTGSEESRRLLQELLMLAEIHVRRPPRPRE